MTPDIHDILLNVLSDFIFFILASLLAAVIGWLFYRSSRRRLLRFFGISETRRINIYLSNIQVSSGGSFGLDGQPRNYEGASVSFEEMLVASSFRNLFISAFPSLSRSLAGFLSGWLISDVQFQILQSPINENQIDTATSFITMGGPAYNSVSRYVEVKLASHAKFENDYSAMIVKNLPPITSLEYGFIERIVDERNGNCQFYTAGLSVLGTTGTARFLSNEWNYLERKHGRRGFTLILKFDESDPTNYAIVMEHEH